MPYTIDYLEDEGGIITTYYGVVTDEEMQNSFVERIEFLKQMPVFRYTVSDCTDIECFEVSSTEIRRNAGQTVELGKKYPDVCIVIITPTNLEYGLGRMWQIYAEDSQWKSFIAHSREEAREWLNRQLMETC